MSSSIGKLPSGAALAIDIPRLVETRLLVQANSGGGKSWALRRLLEQTHGKVQHLVIDPEGEFASLREKFDYVLASRSGGDTLADPRAARLLAERLLELGVSAVLDIYELKAHERVAFVKGFLEALVDAPKKLWHPALVVVDEAHVYCPEKGSAESAPAVIDLATRGRKRGYCAVFATQRLSKFNKDAAAECNNKLIGRTGLDVDMDRAAAELGFPAARRLELRELPEGHFFAFGPALSRGVVAVHVGPVQTTHPTAGGRRAFTAPPPSEKVRGLLPKLADLPAEAEERERTVADLKREITSLKGQLRTAKPGITASVTGKTEPKRVEVPVLMDAQVKRLEAAVARLLAETALMADKVAQRQQVVVTEVGNLRVDLMAAVVVGRQAAQPRPVAPPVPRQAAPPRAPAPPRPASGNGADHAGDLGKGERAVLIAVAQHPQGVARDQLTVLTGYKRSTRDAYIARLRAAGYVDEAGGSILATDEALVALGSDFEPLPTGDALRQHWLGRLPEGERKVFEAVAGAYPEAVERAALDDTVGYKRSTRDAYVQRLSARRLVTLAGRGAVRASDHLFGG